MIPLALHSHSAPTALQPAAPVDGLAATNGFSLAVNAALTASTAACPAGLPVTQEIPLAGIALVAVTTPPVPAPAGADIAPFLTKAAGTKALPVAVAGAVALPVDVTGAPTLPTEADGPAPLANEGAAVPSAPVLKAARLEPVAPPPAEAPSIPIAEAQAKPAPQTPLPPLKNPNLATAVTDAKPPVAELPTITVPAPANSEAPAMSDALAKSDAPATPEALPTSEALAMSQAPVMPGRDQPQPVIMQAPASPTTPKSRAAAKTVIASLSETPTAAPETAVLSSPVLPTAPSVSQPDLTAQDAEQVASGAMADSNTATSVSLSPRAAAALAETASEAAKSVATGGATASFADKLAASDVSAQGRAPTAEAATGTTIGAPVLASSPAPSPPSPLAMLTAVAHAAPTVTARAGQIGREMGVQIARTVSDGNSMLTIRLDPIEMGKIEVKLSFDDRGNLRAVVAAESPAALDMLRRDTADLTRALSDAGVRSDGQSFRFDSRSGSSDGGQFWQRQQQNGKQQNQSGYPDGAAPIEEPVYRTLRSSGRVDLMA